MKRLLFGLAVAGVLVAPSQASAASISFKELAIYVDGNFQDTLIDGTPLTSPGLNDSGFSYVTGLGSLLISLSGAGAHTVVAFYDFDIEDGGTNTFFDDSATTVGAPAAGQGWEIDEPGFGFSYVGDIWTNAGVGALDETIFDGSITVEDVSMALSWDFVLGAGETATLEFLTSLTSPLTGFVLHQTDASGEDLYLSSSFDVQGGQPGEIPEPATLLLVGSGGLAAYRRLRRARAAA